MHVRHAGGRSAKRQRSTLLWCAVLASGAAAAWLVMTSESSSPPTAPAAHRQGAATSGAPRATRPRASRSISPTEAHDDSAAGSEPRPASALFRPRLNASKVSEAGSSQDLYGANLSEAELEKMRRLHEPPSADAIRQGEDEKDRRRAEKRSRQAARARGEEAAPRSRDRGSPGSHVERAMAEEEQP